MRFRRGSHAWHEVAARALVTAVFAAVAVAFFSPASAFGRSRYGGGWGGGEAGGYGGYGGYGNYGGGYQAPPPAYPSYPPAGYGYGAPPPAPGYGAPGYGGYPAQPAYRQPYAYPQQGQSPEQTNATMNECQSWASAQTGYHPQAPGAGPQQMGGGEGGMGRSLLQGGARGAAVGAVGGAIGGNAGKGAAIGAATGGMISVLRRREQRMAEQQQQYQQAQSQAAASSAYVRALESCLSARGYSVR